jgi:hypothetical protein
VQLAAGGGGGGLLPLHRQAREQRRGASESFPSRVLTFPVRSFYYARTTVRSEMKLNPLVSRTNTRLIQHFYNWAPEEGS